MLLWQSQFVTSFSIFSFPLFSCSLLIFVGLIGHHHITFLLRLFGDFLLALIFLLSFLSNFRFPPERVCHLHSADGSLHLVKEFVTPAISLFPTSSDDCEIVTHYPDELFFKVCNLSMSSFMASIRKPCSFLYWWFRNCGPRPQKCRSFFCDLSILFRNWTLHSQSFKFVFEIFYLGLQIRICTPVL